NYETQSQFRRGETAIFIDDIIIIEVRRARKKNTGRGISPQKREVGDLEQMKEVEDQKVSLHEEDVGYKETSKESLWYLDNGASNHMTGVREHFKELDEKVSGKDWSEYLVEHINTKPEWTDFRIENLEENEHHDQENTPNEEDNDFPNNDDDGHDSPLTNSLTYSEALHTPSTRSSQINSYVTHNSITQSSTQSDNGSHTHLHFDHTPIRDFEEVFAPVARMETIRLLLAIAANIKWEVHHLNVKSAFLHGELKEEVYVTQPEGFTKKGNDGKVYRLIKALYGLRQAPRAWNIKLDNTLKSLDFKKCALEQAIYMKASKDSLLLVGVYVDDLIITGTPKREIDKFKAQMEEKFEMSDLGLLAYYLGIEVTQNNGDISIKQSAYANKILKEARMLESNETVIPITPRVFGSLTSSINSQSTFCIIRGCFKS
nr:ribonuclease H-like domain, reverse transcriptase, RNA-dependent DNA polymerase [Tanacetum cinerariifolium]